MYPAFVDSNLPYDMLIHHGDCIYGYRKGATHCVRGVEVSRDFKALQDLAVKEGELTFKDGRRFTYKSGEGHWVEFVKSVIPFSDLPIEVLRRVFEAASKGVGVGNIL
jgi:hypothetical protein